MQQICHACILTHSQTVDACHQGHDAMPTCLVSHTFIHVSTTLRLPPAFTHPMTVVIRFRLCHPWQASTLFAFVHQQHVWLALCPIVFMHRLAQILMSFCILSILMPNPPTNSRGFSMHRNEIILLHLNCRMQKAHIRQAPLSIARSFQSADDWR